MHIEARPAPQRSFEIRRSSRARRSRLTITDDGRAVVVLPLRAAEREAADLVAHHDRWIDRHLRKIAQGRELLAGRPALEAGREVSLGGVARRVVVLAAFGRSARSSIYVSDAGAIVVERSAAERRSSARLLEAWLRSEARDVIGHQLGVRAAEMGIGFSSVAIRDQRTRWGSASRRGTLSFNWRLVMAPPEILDYVVVHELAHLRVAGHGKTFWKLVDRHYADSAGARRWLRANHFALRHALD